MNGTRKCILTDVGSLCNLLLQVSTQLISAATVMYALKNLSRASTRAVVLRPWFIALVAAGAIERLAGLALGVAMERDWVVLVGLLIPYHFCGVLLCLTGMFDL